MPVPTLPTEPTELERRPKRRSEAQRGYPLPRRGDGVRRRRRFVSGGAGLLILISAAALTLSLLQPAPRRTNAAGAPSAPAPATNAPARSPRAAFAGSASGRPLQTGTISRTLAGDVDGLHGHYGVEVIDLASGAEYGVHAQNTFQAASVNKMPILVALYERAQAGQLKLSQTLTLTDADIQHYGTGTIQEPGSPRVYSLGDLAGLMIKVSDNTAAYVLERYLGQAVIQKDIQRWGLTQTSMADNSTTPADAAELLAWVYSDRLLAPAGSQSVLDLLQQTVFTDRLAAGMPAGVPIAHKIGTDAGIFNDAGVILLPGRPYVVAVMSEDADQAEADAAYARINADVLAFQRSLPALASPRP